MKHKRFLGYGALALTFLSLGVAFVRPISSSSLLIRARATDAVDYSQTVSRATGTLVSYTNGKYNYVSTKTTSGTTFYLRSVNDSSYSFSNKYVAVLPGSTDTPSLTPEISFTSGNATASSESMFEFQNIKSISMTSDSTSRTLNVYKSSDGVDWEDAGTIACGGGTNTLVSGANYVKITYSGSYVAYINTLTINYSCSYVPPEPKVLDSISVSGATTEFNVDDTFVFDGTVMASYTNPSLYPSANVTSSAIVVEEPDMSEAAEDVEVVISYTEKGVTKTDSYTISILEAPILSSISVTGYTDTYYIGDTFVFDGVVTASYSNATDKVVTNLITIDDSDLDTSSEGTYDVIISYTEHAITKSNTIQITVEEAQEATIDGTYSITWSSTYATSYLKYQTISVSFVSTNSTSGTGSYNYHQYNTQPDNYLTYDGNVNFSFVIDNQNRITITFVSYGSLSEIDRYGNSKTETYKRNYFQSNNPFVATSADWTTSNTNSTLVWDNVSSPNNITMGIYGTSGSTTTNRVLVKQ